MKFQIHLGDAREVLERLSDNSIEALVTDPPAGIGFMGKDWDHHKGGRDSWIAWLTAIMLEVFRVMKPGAHGLVWAIPRTSHWTATALENAGFEVRDRVSHLFGSGFPKSLDVSKAIDRAAGAERSVIGDNPNHRRAANGSVHQTGTMCGQPHVGTGSITAPATDAAREWSGWGTALKPAVEDWWLIRKPISEKTVAANVLKWGTGALNIDGCRIEAADQDKLAKNWDRTQSSGAKGNVAGGLGLAAIDLRDRAPQGRFPSHLVLSCECQGDQHDLETCAVGMLDAQSGASPSRFFFVAKDNESTIKHGECVDKSSANSANPNSWQPSGRGDFAQRLVAIAACLEVAQSNATIRRSTQEMLSALRRKSGPDTEAIQNSAEKCLLELQRINTSDSDPAIFAAIQGLIGITTTTQSPSKSNFCADDATSNTTSQKSEPGARAFAGSRIAYVAKASRAERNAGLEGMPEKPQGAYGNFAGDGRGRQTEHQPTANHHPTVKPIKLMRYLCRLITPPGGTILDPFMGSGSTGVVAIAEGFEFIGIEREPEYVEIAKRRIEHSEASCPPS